MSDSQIFQLLGLILLPMGLAWIDNPKALRATLRDMANNRGVLLISGMSAITVGFFILAFHSSWTSTSSIVISLLGWVSIMKGLVIIILSSSDLHASVALARMRKYFVVMPWLVSLVGLVSLYFGFFA